MLYQMYEFQRSLLSPLSLWAEASARVFSAPGSAFARLPGAERVAAGYELLHRLGKDYQKPRFDIHSVQAHGHEVPVVELEAMNLPFCRLLRMKRYTDDPATIADLRDDPPVLVVAPLSGHHATLLRDTVRTLLADHKVYITDWIDARMVPAEAGPFHLADYVAYIRRFMEHIGTDSVHVIAVCQPVVPVLAAVSLMASNGEATPQSLVLMGGPVDARKSPTGVNNLAEEKSMSWFRANLIHPVPGHFPGVGRRVYPGFMQHAGFMAMNPRRHVSSHWDFYKQLIAGDLEDAESHRRFYDEYNAVLDMPAEYYLDTVEIVFKRHLLPRGQWEINDQRVEPAAIKGTRLLTIEGELDDIAGLGQTRATHDLCTGLPESMRHHLEVEGAGHYGIFSGRRWRSQVYPKVREFIRTARDNAIKT
ncbi:MAG: polyhydroxyalkanoate depolymerase [Wenzhouxiangella sp.]|nr:polyhydroxyalkanoate depolymerase [Wenzhouxiangella sp.]TVR97995.1 MAG: polyhydroxyalkanoate depolymerase [Wenzhouxiangellaceae bacterium]